MKYKVIYAFNDKYDLSVIHPEGEEFVCNEAERIADLLDRGYIEAIPEEAPKETKKKSSK